MTQKKENKTVEFTLINGKRKRFEKSEVAELRQQYNMFSGECDTVLFYKGGNSYVLKTPINVALKKMGYLNDEKKN